MSLFVVPLLVILFFVVPLLVIPFLVVPFLVVPLLFGAAEIGYRDVVGSSS